MGENKIRIIFPAPVLIFREAPSKSESFPALGRSSRPRLARPSNRGTPTTVPGLEAGSPNWELSPRAFATKVPKQRRASTEAVGDRLRRTVRRIPTTPPRGAAPTAASRSTSSDARLTTTCLHVGRPRVAGAKWRMSEAPRPPAVLRPGCFPAARVLRTGYPRLPTRRRGRAEARSEPPAG